MKVLVRARASSEQQNHLNAESYFLTQQLLFPIFNMMFSQLCVQSGICGAGGELTAILRVVFQPLVWSDRSHDVISRHSSMERWVRLLGLYPSETTTACKHTGVLEVQLLRTFIKVRSLCEVRYVFMA